MATGGRDDLQTANGVMNIGTAIPNRVFVGGISSKTNEEDLRNLFSKYGTVKATKILLDKAGASRGYGFVTFETEEEAQKALVAGECLILKDRKLNVAPAVKKHPYNRNRETGSMNGGPVFWSSHPYAGSPAYPSREASYYPQPNWPLFWHQQLYLPQQYQFPQTQPQPGYFQYLCSVAPPDYHQSGGQGSDYSETLSADSNDSGKNRSRASTPAPVTTEYDRKRSIQAKPCLDQTVSVQKLNGGYGEGTNGYMQSSPVPQLHHVLAKTVNGVAVMAYPAPFVMGSPTIVHMKDGNTESDMLYELGYMHSPLPSGALTPPPTPMGSMSCEFSAVNTSMESSRKS